MALEHADNFTIYGPDTSTPVELMLNGIYSEANSTLANDPDGLSSGRVLNLTGGSGNTRVAWRYPLTGGASATVGIACRVWLTSLPSANDKDFIQEWRDVGNNVLASLKVNTVGGLTMTITGGASYTTVAPAISATGWYHIESKYVTEGSSLVSFEVRVEGVTVLSQTSVAGSSTQTSQCAAKIDAISHTWGAYTKDLVIWTGTGSQNNNFLGSVLVTNLVPNSDVSLNWTPSTGTTGYEILDNIPPSDTIYIAAGDPPPSPYVGNLSNLPADVSSVKGLITFVRAAKSDGGDGSLQVGLISDPSGTPTTGLGANRPITVAQTYWRDVFELDPDTGAAWLPASVDAAQIQINRTV